MTAAKKYSVDARSTYAACEAAFDSQTSSGTRGDLVYLQGSVRTNPPSRSLSFWSGATYWQEGHPVAPGRTWAQCSPSRVMTNNAANERGGKGHQTRRSVESTNTLLLESGGSEAYTISYVFSERQSMHQEVTVNWSPVRQTLPSTCLVVPDVSELVHEHIRNTHEGRSVLIPINRRLGHFNPRVVRTQVPSEESHAEGVGQKKTARRKAPAYCQPSFAYRNCSRDHLKRSRVGWEYSSPRREFLRPNRWSTLYYVRLLL